MSMKSNDDVGYGAVLVREKLKKYKVRMKFSLRIWVDYDDIEGF